MSKKAIKAKSFYITLIIILTSSLLIIGYNLYLKSTQRSGEKEIIIEVINDAKSYYKSFTVKTEQIFLGDVLEELKMAEFISGPFGRYIISINGMGTDESNREWWSIMINNEFAQTGIDEISIRDNHKYTFKLETGFN